MEYFNGPWQGRMCDLNYNTNYHVYRFNKEIFMFTNKVKKNIC